MPIPKPKYSETKKEFLDRCMIDSTMVAEYDDKQRYAICQEQLERNIKIVTGSPCSGKNTYIKNNKRKGDLIWDFDKIHSALTDAPTHEHIEEVRKYIFSMRNTFYNDLKDEKDLRVWIINSSPLKEVRENLAQELNAEIIYIKRSKEECLEVARNERPEAWSSYIDSYFERFEEIEENENITIIEVKTMEKEINERHIKKIMEDEKSITIVYSKTEDFEGIEVDESQEVEIDDDEILIQPAIGEAKPLGAKTPKGEGVPSKPAAPSGGRSLEPVDVWDKKHTQEKRFFEVETRIDNVEGKDVVVGHAAVFDSLSEDLGGFRERIMKGAFDDVLNNDTRAYFNHDPNYLLGRVSAGTLRLSVDEKGLRYELDIPNTTAGRDLKENLKNGNITQSSFAFTLDQDGDYWERNDDGVDIRVIKRVAKLYDVSPVSLPAYPSANNLALAVRSNYIDKENKRKEEEQKFELETLNLKINLLKRKK